jgi:DNA-binding NarL/FixJ family response regulator
LFDLPETQRRHRSGRAPRALDDSAHVIRIGPSRLQRLARAFSLTEGEAHLAHTLYAGAPIADAASRLGLAESAARDEVRSICRKLNAATEADMLRVLSTIQRTSSAPP